MDEFKTGNQPYSPPPMSDELMYQIIFSMEDQASTYFFDLREGVPVQAELVRCGREEREARYRDLPAWKPADGFRIMEKFISSLKNPLFRERLKDALAKGKGVFRNFKNTIKEEPAVERLWYYFKEREIKRIIYIWYEQLTEVSYLEAIGEPEQDVADLILSDFSITTDSERWSDYIKDIGHNRLETEYAGVDYPLNELLVEEYQRSWGTFDDSWLMVFVETPGEEFAGFIGAEPVEIDGGRQIYSVRHLYVEPRFRGLGIFKMLIDALCGRAAETGADRLIVELSGKSSVTIPALEHRGFTPFSERFALDLAKWRREQGSWADEEL